MTGLKKDNNIQPSKKNLFELFTEIVGWLQIAAAPVLIGSAMGVIIYFLSPNKTGLIVAVFIGTTGLIAGIVWANRVWKKKGTINFMSRVMASPELDNIKDDDEK